MEDNKEIEIAKQQVKLYNAAVIENCIIFILVFIGVVIFKQPLMLLLLLFVNYIRHKK